MFDRFFLAQRYRSLIFMDFVHSKFGCRENTFFVDFVQTEIGNLTPSSRLQEHPQARGSRLKKKKMKTAQLPSVYIIQEILDTTILVKHCSFKCNLLAVISVNNYLLIILV